MKKKQKKGRKPVGSEHAKKVGDPYKWIQSYALDPANQKEFPDISSLEFATLAARIFPDFKDAKKACKAAGELLRESALEIENQKNLDFRTKKYADHNEVNSVMWRNLGRDIKAKSKGKTLREREGIDEMFYPFPVSQQELFQFMGIPKSTGYARIKKILTSSQKKNYPEKTSEEIEAEVKEIRARGIYQPLFLEFARSWPELQEAMEQWREER